MFCFNHECLQRLFQLSALLLNRSYHVAFRQTSRFQVPIYSTCAIDVCSSSLCLCLAPILPVLLSNLDLGLVTSGILVTVLYRIQYHLHLFTAIVLKAISPPHPSIASTSQRVHYLTHCLCYLSLVYSFGSFLMHLRFW